jgi:hypothetical protein
MKLNNWKGWTLLAACVIAPLALAPHLHGNEFVVSLATLCMLAVGLWSAFKLGAIMDSEREAAQRQQLLELERRWEEAQAAREAKRVHVDLADLARDDTLGDHLRPSAQALADLKRQ